MQYKTIVLGLLEQQPSLYQQLTANKTIAQMLERLAIALSHCHQSWMTELQKVGTVSDPTQLTSRALELALRELQEDLQPESLLSDEEDQSLDLQAAMMFIFRHTPDES